MNKLIIYQYINRLRRDDIVNFCNFNGFRVSDNEIDTVYSYIKNDYKRFFSNPDVVLDEVRGKVSDNGFRIIMELYNKYKKFI